MLITTNQVVTQWGTVFGDEVLAAAILDRLLHHSHTLMIQGESYRLRQKKRAGLLGRTSFAAKNAGVCDVTPTCWLLRGARRRGRLALTSEEHGFRGFRFSVVWGSVSPDA